MCLIVGCWSLHVYHERHLPVSEHQLHLCNSEGTGLAHQVDSTTPCSQGHCSRCWCLGSRICNFFRNLLRRRRPHEDSTPHAHAPQLRCAKVRLCGVCYRYLRPNPEQPRYTHTRAACVCCAWPGSHGLIVGYGCIVV